MLTKASDAKTENRKGQEQEIVALAYNSALIKKLENGDSTPLTSEDMNIELQNQRAYANGSNPIIITFSDSSRQYSVYSNGKVEYIGEENALDLLNEFFGKGLDVVAYYDAENTGFNHGIDPIPNADTLITFIGGFEDYDLNWYLVFEYRGNNYKVNVDTLEVTEEVLEEYFCLCYSNRYKIVIPYGTEVHTWNDFINSEYNSFMLNDSLTSIYACEDISDCFTEYQFFFQSKNDVPIAVRMDALYNERSGLDNKENITLYNDSIVKGKTYYSYIMPFFGG